SHQPDARVLRLQHAQGFRPRAPAGHREVPPGAGGQVADSPKPPGRQQTPCFPLFTRDAGGLTFVDAGGLKPNTWQRFERLSSAWCQARLGIDKGSKPTPDDEPRVVTTPRR